MNRIKQKFVTFTSIKHSFKKKLPIKSARSVVFVFKKILITFNIFHLLTFKSNFLIFLNEISHNIYEKHFLQVVKIYSIF